jgi:uncharacterized integral membrane protein (TIGR00698 family)
VPGVALAAVLALGAVGLRRLPWLDKLSPLILGLVLGVLVRNLFGVPAAFHAGLAFSLRRVLRFAVALLGFQVSLQQVYNVGAAGLLVVVAALAATYAMAVWLGARLGIDRKLAHLVAAGTSVCGASAVLAANTVVEGSDEDAAYAVSVVTVFGTVAMLTYPLLPSLLGLSPEAYGLWAGASVHEVAQVVAAADPNGLVSLELATITKLARVLLLAPLVVVIGYLVAGHTSAAARPSWRRLPVPLFVTVFIALVVLNSMVTVPAAARDWLRVGVAFMLSMALAAMGLEMHVAKAWRRGVRPIILGAVVSLFIAGLSLALIRTLGF